MTSLSVLFKQQHHVLIPVEGVLVSNPGTRETHCSLHTVLGLSYGGALQFSCRGFYITAEGFTLPVPSSVEL